MALNREAIYSALLTLFQPLTTNNGVVTLSRALKHYEDVDPVNQPAIYLAQVEENVVQMGGGTKLSGLPDKIIMTVKLYVYVYNTDQDPASTPWVAMNNLLDAIHALLKPTGGARRHDVNLGGIVDSVRISGKITTDEGWLGPQAVAIVPVEIQVTAT